MSSKFITALTLLFFTIFSRIFGIVSLDTTFVLTAIVGSLMAAHIDDSKKQK